MAHLEYLENPAILELSKINTTTKVYYKKKNNLILYLKTWLQILEGKIEPNNFSNKGKLQADLLVAINQENYAKAAGLRDEILQLEQI